MPFMNRRATRCITMVTGRPTSSTCPQSRFRLVYLGQFSVALSQLRFKLSREGRVSPHQSVQAFFFFFFFGRPQGIWTFPAQGLNLSRSFNTHHSCSNVRSSTNCSRLGMETKPPQRRRWIFNLLRHSRNSQGLLLTYCIHLGPWPASGPLLIALPT